MFNKGAEKVLFLLKETAGATGSVSQNENIFKRVVGQGILFQISPNILDRVEIGRVGRKKEGLEGGGSREKCSCFSSQVSVESVPHKHNRPL